MEEYLIKEAIQGIERNLDRVICSEMFKITERFWLNSLLERRRVRNAIFFGFSHTIFYGTFKRILKIKIF